jgi:hypothetical protein
MRRNDRTSLGRRVSCFDLSVALRSVASAQRTAQSFFSSALHARTRKANDQPAVEKTTLINPQAVTTRNLQPDPVPLSTEFRRRLFGVGLFPSPVEIMMLAIATSDLFPTRGRNIPIRPMILTPGCLILEPGCAGREGRVNYLNPRAMSAHNLLVAEPTDFCFRWRHRDGSTVEFNPSGWVSSDPSKADWLVKMNELCSSKPAICPVVRFWLREYCELIDFHCSERLEPNGAKFRNKERTKKKRFSVIRKIFAAFSGKPEAWIALWRQRLARGQKSRSWTVFSNWNKGERKKVGYTAETNRFAVEDGRTNSVRHIRVLDGSQ